MQKQEEQTYETKLSLTRLHFFYIVLILIGSLILMATRDWTKLDGFTEYLSVSATITSLVLGVLAIIYGFISSNSTNSSLGSVQAAAYEMKDVGSQLKELLSKGQELQEKAGSRNEELHSLIGNLRSTIDDLSTSTTHIAGTVEMLPVKIDSLRNEIFGKSVSQITPGVEAEQEAKLQTNQIQQFLSVSSIIGLAALKAIVEAKRLTKPADLEKIFKDDYSDSTAYAQGYLVASSCFGIVDFELEGGTKKVVKISFSGESDTLIEHEWSKREKSDDESSRNSISKYINKINASFTLQQSADAT
ncbi:hypothetical protein [Methylotenera sp.]|uniref:hypothetical protein n=1 Tax=Methylotenera sp. TaxID=2051956 RepID=UPI002ED7F844